MGQLTRDQLMDMLPPDFNWEPFEKALVLLSSEVGIIKPDPQIFSLAVNLTMREPSRSLFVTDEHEVPVAGEENQFFVRVALPVISADGDPGNLDILMDSILTMKLARLDNYIAMR